MKKTAIVLIVFLVCLVSFLFFSKQRSGQIRKVESDTKVPTTEQWTNALTNASQERVIPPARLNAISNEFTRQGIALDQKFNLRQMKTDLFENLPSKSEVSRLEEIKAFYAEGLRIIGEVEKSLNEQKTANQFNGRTAVRIPLKDSDVASVVFDADGKNVRSAKIRNSENSLLYSFTLFTNGNFKSFTEKAGDKGIEFYENAAPARFWSEASPQPYEIRWSENGAISFQH